MRFRVVGAFLLLFAMGLGGCVGSDGTDEAADSGATGPAVYDEDTGAIEGLVTDEEFAPLADVTVGLLELTDVVTTTNEEGQFALSNIPPGLYTLVVQKLGYESVAQKVEVPLGDTASAQLAMPLLPVQVPYPETIIFSGIIRNGVGVIRTATCSNCNINDNNKETVARFQKGKLPEDYAAVMIESTWKSRDYIGIDFLDRTAGHMYWRIRSLPPIHFLLERCGNYVGAPHYGRQPMPCTEDNLSANKVHIENWYIGEFQRETHTLDPVCQTPIGAGGTTVVPGYQAGCYGLGFIPELRFTNYITVFHIEMPADAATRTFMPDA